MKDEKSASRLSYRPARLLSDDLEPIERKVPLIGEHLPSQMGRSSAREPGRMDWYQLTSVDTDGTLLFTFVETLDREESDCPS